MFDRDEFEGWLGKQPVEVSLVIAARCALRVAPGLRVLSQTADNHRAIILPLFRGMATPWVAATCPTHGVVGWANAAITNANVANAANAAATAATNAAYSVANAATAAAFATAANAAYSATAATNAANAAANAAYSAAANAAATAANAAANAATNAAANAAAVAAIQSDKQDIESGVSARVLGLQPLWGDVTNPFAGEWSRMAKQLSANEADEHWSVWIDWYEARLKGGPIKEDLEIARLVEVTDKEWEQGPAVANARIKKILARFSGKAPAISTDIMASELGLSPPVAVPNIVRFEASLAFDFSIPGGPLEPVLDRLEGDYQDSRDDLDVLSQEVQRWFDSGDAAPDWEPIKHDIARLSRLLAQGYGRVCPQMGRIWTAGVRLASWLDFNRELLAQGPYTNTQPLPSAVRRELENFMTPFAAWVLAYPDAAEKEARTIGFHAPLERVNKARNVLVDIQAHKALNRDDLDLVFALLKASEGEGPQQKKARAWSINTIKALVLAGLVVAGDAAVSEVTGDVADQSQILDNVESWILEGEQHVLEFLSDEPGLQGQVLKTKLHRIREAVEARR